MAWLSDLGRTVPVEDASRPSPVLPAPCTPYCCRHGWLLPAGDPARSCRSAHAAVVYW